MRFQLKLLSLTANIPLQHSNVFLSVQDISQSNSSLSCSGFQDINQYVLSPEPTEVYLSEDWFIIEVQNPEEQKSVKLKVMAKSFSTPRLVFFGSVEIDLWKPTRPQFQIPARIISRQPLLGVHSQKGYIFLQINPLDTQLESSHGNIKSKEQLDKEQTCSSDSHQANLKQLNKSASSEDTQDFSPKFKQSLEVYPAKVDYSQKIIFEQVGRQDEQDSELFESLHFHQQMGSVFCEKKLKNKTDHIQRFLLREKFKVQSYLHNLHETDFLLLRMQEKLRAFRE